MSETKTLIIPSYPNLALKAELSECARMQARENPARLKWQSNDMSELSTKSIHSRALFLETKVRRH
jgi:hypothetical protein